MRPCADCPNRRQQLGIDRPLHDVAGGAGSPRSAEVAELIVDREDDDPRPWTDPLDGGNRGQPFAVWHADVHQHDVRLGGLDPDLGLGAVGRLADHFHVRLQVDEGAQAAPQDPMLSATKTRTLMTTPSRVRPPSDLPRATSAGGAANRIGPSM